MKNNNLNSISNNVKKSSNNFKTHHAGWYNESLYTEQNSILVEGHGFGSLSGGIEAMIQLSIALAEATYPKPQVYITINYIHDPKVNKSQIVYHERYIKLYGDKLIYQTKAVEDMKPKDIYIVSEFFGCRGIPQGASRYIYLLANGSHYGMYCIEKSNKYLSHNKYLSQIYIKNSQEDYHVRIPMQRILTPYISTTFVEEALSYGGLSTKTGLINYHEWSLKDEKLNQHGRNNVVLIDGDVPGAVLDIIKSTASNLFIHSQGVEVIVLQNFNRTELMSLYKRAKVIVDWCMPGSERCPLEAALYGVLLITNHCKNGQIFEDYPIPSKYISKVEYDGTKGPLTKEETMQLKEFFNETISDVIGSYYDHLNNYASLRYNILRNNPKNMKQEAVRFLNTIHLSDSYAKVNSTLALSHNGCIGC